MYAYNYYAYYIYYYYGEDYLSYFGYSDIYQDLDDAPFIVTGDTVVCDLGRAKITDYTEDYGDFYIVGYNDGYDYYGVVDIVTNSLIGSYTGDDFDMSYTSLYTADGTQIKLKYAISADITAGTGDTTYVINAKLMGKDGNVYDVNMKAYPLAATDTITIDITDATLDDETADYGVFEIYGGNANYEVTAAFYASAIDGTYTQDDAYTYSGYTFTYITVIAGSDTTYVDFDDTYTYTGVTNGSVYTATLEGLGDDAHYYVVNFTANLATALGNVADDKKVAKKYIDNGRVVIELGDQKYNVLGTKISE